MLRIEQGFPGEAFADARDHDDPLLLFMEHIHHYAPRRVGQYSPDEALARVVRPTEQKVLEDKSWQSLRAELPDELMPSPWELSRTGLSEWPQVCIWLAARGLHEETEPRLEERLTILSYPSATEQKVRAFLEGDPVGDDLLVATASVVALTKVIR